MDEIMQYSEEDSNDKFYKSIEDNEHLLAIYNHIILNFEQKFPEARISYTENYVGVKLNGGNNRCWFKRSGTKAFEFRFRININQKHLENNSVSYTISSRNEFDKLIPLIKQVMAAEQDKSVASDKKDNGDKKCLTFNDVIQDDSDVVKIFSTGSCNPSTRCGKYHALLEYKSRYKTIIGELTDTTTNRCIIYGLIEAVKLLKKPCKAFLVTSTSTGIETAIKRGKGTNVDILITLFKLLKEKSCEVEFVVLEGEGDKLNSFIFSKMVVMDD